LDVILKIMGFIPIVKYYEEISGSNLKCGGQNYCVKTPRKTFQLKLF